MKHSNTSHRRGVRVGSLGAMAVAAILAAAGCAPVAPAAPNEEVAEFGISDADYTLDALIEAAKLEGPITVSDGTGKIVEMAENFTAKYGIEATGVKMSVTEQQEVVIREAQATNVQTDVFSMADVPTAMAELVPQGYVTSWMPPDLKSDLPEIDQSPVVVVVQSGLVWAYNTEIYGDTCPVDNIWDLTSDEWEGRVSFSDPLLLSELIFWFNQMETHSDDLVADAYEAYAGKKLKTDEASATAEWVKQLASNGPLIVKEDADAAAAVGAPGQTAGFMGFMTTSKFRDNSEKDYKLGLCSDMEPWIGHWTPKAALIASGTASPNASKLFVHFMLTEEGMAPQLEDGKMSTNTTVAMVAGEESGVEKFKHQMHYSDSSTAADDFKRLPEWQDFWRTNSR